MDALFDWNRMRAFLAAAEGGSLSAAARTLSLTQPTLSRQIAALETELGLMLFERVGKGLQLTDAGKEMLSHVREMGEAANKVALVAAGQSQTVEGRVRVTATDVTSAIYLPEAMSRIRALAPRIQIEIIASNDIRDLMRREADIAVRHVRPEQPDLVARLVRDANAYLYGSKEYFARPTRPKTTADFAAHDFISFGDDESMATYMQGIGLPVTEKNFRFSSDNGLVAWALARQGLGLVPMDEGSAVLAPEMERALPGMDPIVFPIWLTTHREIHTSPRIRLVFDVLAEVLSEGFE